jgi:hypothetical protein
MPIFTYKKNIRLIAEAKTNGRVTFTLIGTFDSKGELSTSVAATVALLNKAQGITRKGA